MTITEYKNYYKNKSNTCFSMSVTIVYLKQVWLIDDANPKFFFCNFTEFKKKIKNFGHKMGWGVCRMSRCNEV